MVGLFLSIAHLFLALYAIVRSTVAHFWLGTIAGALRAVLIAVGAVVGLRLGFLGGADPPVGLARLALVIGVVGPVLSFATVFIAYRRMSNVPAREEEAALRPFMAWLPVAIVDAIFVVLAIMAGALASGP